MKAMASDVDRRYPSADAMLEDLEEFRKNPSIRFDYTLEDLAAGEGDEPTQTIGATPPPAVPVHAERREEKSRPVRDRREERRRARRRREEYEDDEDYDEGGRRGVWIALVIVLLIAGMAAIGMFLWNTVFRDMVDQGQTYVVPDLYNYTMEEALALPDVTQNGFTIVEGSYLSSEEVEAGRILSQSPAADEVVKAGGQTITVDISTGAGGLLMPDLYNQDRRVAESTLRNMGLEVNVVEENSDDITKGNVISQTPEARESVESGGLVTLVVSLGRSLKDVQMISLIDLSLDEATRILTEDLGLRLGSVTPEASDLAEGRVCYQSVQPYSLVKEETVVNLKVSTGAGVVQPPDVTTSGEPGPDASAEHSGQVTSTPQPAARKDGTVSLPNDRDTVNVRVTVDGVEQYNQQVDTKLRTAHFTVEGAGSQEVVVYIDGVETARYTEEFSG